MFGLLYSLFIGAVSGYIAATLMGIDRSSVVFNCGLGLIGGIVAGIIAGFFGIASTNFIGHTIFAVAGACLVVYLYQRYIA